MIMVETDGAVTGGVDTHLDVHVAAALDPIGGLLGVAAFDTTGAGYEALLAWLTSFGVVHRVGVEGTGSDGTGLARFLMGHDVEVIEVDRPNRQERSRTGKSDPVDAVEAARAALSGRATGLAKTKDGPVEAIRALLVARRSARNHRISTLVQMRHLVFTAPPDLRDRFFGLSKTQLVKQAAGLRPRDNGDPVTYTTKVALKSLAQRVQLLETQIKQIRSLLRPLITAAAPTLLDVNGVGIDAAAILLVAAGDNSDRLKNEAAFARLCGVAPLEASSGKVARHRLNRGGNRQANHALYQIILSRLASDPETKRNVQRRTQEGKSIAEIVRCLKRYAAREVFKHLPHTI